jgi:beta-xylosidase
LPEPVDHGGYWLYPTGDGESFSAWHSSDLVTWQQEKPLLRIGDIAWIEDGAPQHYLWAPHMIAANGRYYLYYAVGPQDPTPSRIGVALCDGADGPCVDSGKPLLTGDKGFEAIDPMVFEDPKSGTRFLYAGGSNGATLRIYILSPDCVTIAQEVKIDQPPGFTEAPWMHTRNGLYYLSYSSGHWNNASYSVRYAISSSPTGPWKFAGTILRSKGSLKGPGHHAFFEDPGDHQWYVVYGRWDDKLDKGPYRGQRTVAIDKLHYSPAGLIEFITMSPSKR